MSEDAPAWEVVLWLVLISGWTQTRTNTCEKEMCYIFATSVKSKMTRGAPPPSFL